MQSSTSIWPYIYLVPSVNTILVRNLTGICDFSGTAMVTLKEAAAAVRLSDEFVDGEPPHCPRQLAAVFGSRHDSDRQVESLCVAS